MTFEIYDKATYYLGQIKKIEGIIKSDNSIFDIDESVASDVRKILNRARSFYEQAFEHLDTGTPIQYISKFDINDQVCRLALLKLEKVVIDVISAKEYDYQDKRWIYNIKGFGRFIDADLVRAPKYRIGSTIEQIGVGPPGKPPKKLQIEDIKYRVEDGEWYYKFYDHKDWFSQSILNEKEIEDDDGKSNTNNSEV